MKKMITAIALIVTLGFIAAQGADARWGEGRGYGPGGCGSCDTQAYSEEKSEAFKNFQEATGELRSQLFEKRREYAETMNGENIDREKAREIWNEMFDLQSELKEQANAAGVDPGYGRRGRFAKNRDGNRFCNGPQEDCSGSGNCWKNN